MSREKHFEFVTGVAWTLPIWILVIAALAVHP